MYGIVQQQITPYIGSTRFIQCVKLRCNATHDIDVALVGLVRAPVRLARIAKVAAEILGWSRDSPSSTGVRAAIKSQLLNRNSIVDANPS
jgi:hypothetical protein